MATATEQVQSEETGEVTSHGLARGEVASTTSPEAGTELAHNSDSIKYSSDAGQVNVDSQLASKPVVEKEPTGQKVLLTGYGGYNKLKVADEPIPKPEKDEVIVNVKYCGINFADLMMRQGIYGLFVSLPKPPYVIGIECSGIIHSVGTDVKMLKVGDRVLCLKSSSCEGVWREYARITVEHCFLIPESMGLDEAAALAINYVTAYLMLFDMGNLRPGKSVLVHMAAGGVGVALTQLCKTVPDVTVFGTASAQKHEFIAAQGVTHPIDYRTKDWQEEVLKISPKGVDIVMDPLGGKDGVKGLNTLKPMGKIIHFGSANMVSGEQRSLLRIAATWWKTPNISPLSLISQNKCVCGFHMGFLEDSPEVVVETIHGLFDLHKQGKIKPVIDSVWPLHKVTDAMRVIQERRNMGKVLLTTLDVGNDTPESVKDSAAQEVSPEE